MEPERKAGRCVQMGRCGQADCQMAITWRRGVERRVFRHGDGRRPRPDLVPRVLHHRRRTFRRLHHPNINKMGVKFYTLLYFLDLRRVLLPAPLGLKSRI